MTSLINEYRRRHKSNFVWPLNDGVCFFTKKNKPAIIVMASENGRNLTNCKKCCSLDTNLVGEGFLLNTPTSVHSMKRIFHEHIRPDADLCCLVNNFEKEYEPIALKSDMEADLFLWRAFLQTKPFAGDKDFTAIEQKLNSSISNVRLKTIETMIWSLVYRKEVYTFYYDKVYTPIFAGRKYILYR